jgi:hypothetical protein
VGLLLSWLYQRRWIALGSLIGLLIVVLVGPYLPNAKWWTGPAVIILVALMLYDVLNRGGLRRWQRAAIAVWIGLLMAGFWTALGRMSLYGAGVIVAGAVFVVLGTTGVMAIATPALLRARRRSRTDRGSG